MARRRFNNNQRHELLAERSFQEYVLSTPVQQITRTELLRLVRGGEDTYLELKVKLSNPEKIAQGICALANTGGGIIVFGVTDQLRVEGLSEPETVQAELVRICREDLVPQLTPYVDAIAFDSGKVVLALEVKGKRRPYRTRDGRCYIRNGAEKREAGYEELAALLDDVRPVSYENLAAIGARIQDVDEAHLWAFVREFEVGKSAGAGLEDYPTAEVLEKDLLLAVPTGLSVQPSVAGLLLFGIDARVAELLPRAAVTVTRFSGDTVQSPIIEGQVIGGNLLTVYENVLGFIERYSDLWDAPLRLRAEKKSSSSSSLSSLVPDIVFRNLDSNGSNNNEASSNGNKNASSVNSSITLLGRASRLADESLLSVARANYHRACVCEALVNALAHRDLILRERPTRINIFDRSLEIINARRTAQFSQVANRAIRYGIPQRLNPQLHSLLTNPAYGLRAKRTDTKAYLTRGGLPMMLREGRSFSGKAVDVNLFNDEFRVRLHAA